MQGSTTVFDPSSSEETEGFGDAANSTGTAPATSTASSSSSSDDDADSSATESTGTTGSGPAEPLKVVVLSDLNGSYGSTTYDASVSAAVDAVLALGPDLVLSTGDMVAGQQAGLDYSAMWQGFHATVSDPLAAAAVPFAVSPGNHDASGYPAYVEERTEYAAQWMPRKPEVAYLDDTAFPWRYSFSMGPALFVSLDDTTVGALSEEQMVWLDEQLTAGSDFEVKIVFGHIPLWAFAQGREDEIIGDPDLEALLEEHQVTAFISGHHHAFYPGRRGAIRHVGMACLGGGPRALVGDDAPAPRAFAVLEIDPLEGLVSVEALREPDFLEPIDRSSLPESISVADVTLIRDDLGR